MKLFTVLVAVGLACAALASPSLDGNVLKTIGQKSTADIIISFKGANVSAVRTQAKSRVLGASRAIRNEAMFHALNDHANATQANVLGMLRSHRSASSMIIRPFWITNQIAGKRADLHVVSSLMDMEEISEITEAAVGTLTTPVRTQTLPRNYVNAGEQWGVANIEAPVVWERDNARGQGVVIGSLDTGAFVEHEALEPGFRALNGWIDPVELEKTPTDPNGHGTHTIGTITGRTNGIGVAPEAQWIACKGMDRRGSGNDADFIFCGEFFACPFDTDGENLRCDLAPQAVSNSWGYIGNFGFFDQVIETWIDFDIAPIFGAGNEGTRCSTLRAPGSSALSITVGATNSSDMIASFSSRGPNPNGLLKPDVSAPGQNIVSAISGADNAIYGSMSGTSMSTPHVAGLAALLYSKKPDLTPAQLRELLQAGSQPTVPTGAACGSLLDDGYPNNHVGYGRISARASMDELNRRFP